MKRTALLLSAIICCSTMITSAQDKGYYGLLETTGGYIYKYVPGSATAPQDFILGVSYVNGYRFSPHFAMGVGFGVNYYFDFQQFSAPLYLHLNSDILKRDITPYISINIGNNFQLNDGKYNYGIYDGMIQDETSGVQEIHAAVRKHYRGFFAEPSVGIRFNFGGKRANVGLAYAADGILDRTTDAYRRDYHPQIRLKFGMEF